MTTGGKGSKRRPTNIPMAQADANWDAIFGKKKPIDKEALDVYNEERLVSKYDKENLKGKE